MSYKYYAHEDIEMIYKLPESLFASIHEMRTETRDSTYKKSGTQRYNLRYVV